MADDRADQVKMLIYQIIYGNSIFDELEQLEKDSSPRSSSNRAFLKKTQLPKWQNSRKFSDDANEYFSKDTTPKAKDSMDRRETYAGLNGVYKKFITGDQDSVNERYRPTLHERVTESSHEYPRQDRDRRSFDEIDDYDEFDDVRNRFDDQEPEDERWYSSDRGASRKYLQEQRRDRQSFGEIDDYDEFDDARDRFDDQKPERWYSGDRRSSHEYLQKQRRDRPFDATDDYDESRPILYERDKKPSDERLREERSDKRPSNETYHSSKRPHNKSNREQGTFEDQKSTSGRSGHLRSDLAEVEKTHGNIVEEDEYSVPERGQMQESYTATGDNLPPSAPEYYQAQTGLQQTGPQLTPSYTQAPTTAYENDVRYSQSITSSRNVGGLDTSGNSMNQAFHPTNPGVNDRWPGYDRRNIQDQQSSNYRTRTAYENPPQSKISEDSISSTMDSSSENAGNRGESFAVDEASPEGLVPSSEDVVDDDSSDIEESSDESGDDDVADEELSRETQVREEEMQYDKDTEAPKDLSADEKDDQNNQERKSSETKSSWLEKEEDAATESRQNVENEKDPQIDEVAESSDDNTDDTEEDAINAEQKSDTAQTIDYSDDYYWLHVWDF